MKKWRPITRAEVFNTFKTDRRSLEDVVDCLNERMAELFPGEDEPKPEPAPEDPPDYSCPVCGEDTLDSSGKCQCGVWSSLAAANRKIAQLARERDTWHDMYDSANRHIDQLTEERDEARMDSLERESEQGNEIHEAARAQAIQDTKNAAVKALEEEFYDWAVGGTQIAAAAVRIMLNLELK